MVSKSNKNHPPVYGFLWIVWTLLWVIVPFRLIRPLFFDKFIYMKDPKYGYKITGDGSFCNSGLNSDGYRGGEFYPKRDGEYLVMVVGDSLVYGQGLKIEDRFTNRLENKLNHLRKHKVRVLNMGKCGTNIYMNFDTLNRYRQKLDPDLIVFSLYYNDLLLESDFSDFPPFVHNNGEPIVLNPHSDPKYTQRVLGSFSTNTLNFKMLTSIVEMMPKEKTLYYWLSNKDPDKSFYELSKVFVDYRLLIIDNYDLYFRKYRGLSSRRKYELRISEKESHPNALANEMFAERLYQEITQNPKWGFTE